MTRPEVSVVIPTRDRWEILFRRALRAALLQEDVEIEVIVVDDGSSDETLVRLAEIGDARVRVIQNRRTGSAARARNTGVEEARAPWVAFLDDDDAWSPHKLRVQLDAVRSAGADFTYAAVVSVDDAGEVIYAFALPPAGTLRRDVLARPTVPAGSSNILARSDLVKQLGGFDDRLANIEDWDMWIRLAWAGAATAVPDTLVACLEHRGGKALTTPMTAFAALDYLDVKHRALRDEHGIDLDRVAYWHYVAWLQLRQRRRVRAAGLYARSAIHNRRPEDALLALRFAARALLPTRRAGRRASTDRVPAPDWLDLYR